jgi:hypothetical protein
MITEIRVTTNEYKQLWVAWQRGTGAAIAWAFVGMACFTGWQTLTVERNYGGNWTALFCTGTLQRVPPELIRGTFRFEGLGYDGQMSRYVAHDPWAQGIDHIYLDDYSLRQRRILVPVSAWLLSFGRPQWIDFAYFAVLAVFVLLGVYWAGIWMMLDGQCPAWGLAYLLVPSTLIAADRCTLDVAAASLTIAMLLYVRRNRCHLLYVCAILICLSRETGLLVVLGVALSLVLERRPRVALAVSTTALPALGWYLYVYFHRPSAGVPTLPAWLGKGSPFGVLIRLTHPIRYPFQGGVAYVAQSFDCLALIGILLAFVLTVYTWSRRPEGTCQVTALVFLLLLPLVSATQFWDSAYGYSRPFAPLLVSLALGSTQTRSFPWVGTLPMVLILPRLALQLGPQVAGIFHVDIR